MELARAFIKYKWLIFAFVLTWSFALAGRLWVENASAAVNADQDNWTGCNTFVLGTSTVNVLRQQTFTPTKSNLDYIQIQVYTANPTARLKMKIYKGTPSGSNIQYLGEATSTLQALGGSDYYGNFYFSPEIYTYPNEVHFFQVQGDNALEFQLKTASGCAGAGDYYQNYVFIGNDIPYTTYWDDGASPVEPISPNTDYDTVEIYNDPFFERHHLEVPPLQWCVNDNSQPCYVNFSFNDRSWSSGIKLYNDGENGSWTGNYLSSTTALDFFPNLNGKIELSHTATTSEGYDYYCLRLYSATGAYADELTCGIKVLFVSPSTLTCAWDKTVYEAEHDAGQICADIATSSIWETGSWPGAMECAGRKIAYYAFTASSSDYYDLCKASLATTEKFPFSVINDIRRKINDWSSSTEPATTSQAMLPFYWAGASTSADLLPVNTIRARLEPTYSTIYNWLVILIWVFAGWIIVKDVLQLNSSSNPKVQIKK